jgi:transcription antitermination protein NusB
LQTLYACEIGADNDSLRALAAIADGAESNPDVRGYAQELVTAVVKDRERIDALLSRHAANWDIKRMAAVDRNLLRLAVAELGMRDRTPPKVVMDEAVELAKIYSTEESSRFVNGVVDSIYREMTG